MGAVLPLMSRKLSCLLQNRIQLHSIGLQTPNGSRVLRRLRDVQRREERHSGQIGDRRQGGGAAVGIQGQGGMVLMVCGIVHTLAYPIEERLPVD